MPKAFQKLNYISFVFSVNDLNSFNIIFKEEHDFLIILGLRYFNLGIIKNKKNLKKDKKGVIF